MGIKTIWHPTVTNSLFTLIPLLLQFSDTCWSDTFPFLSNTNTTILFLHFYNCYIGALIDSMVENTCMKQLQNKVKNNVEDLRHFLITVKKLEITLVAQSKSKYKKMDQNQVTLQQSIENVSQSYGSSRNSGTTIKVTLINSIPW